MPQAEAQALFKEYLRKADELAKEPKWYNTLSSNCTTLVFDMAQAVSQQQLPSDYRLLASGYLPDYLYDLKALDQRWDIQTWYQRAHVNPRVRIPVRSPVRSIHNACVKAYLSRVPNNFLSYST